MNIKINSEKITFQHGCVVGVAELPQWKKVKKKIINKQKERKKKRDEEKRGLLAFNPDAFFPFKHY